MRHRTRRRSVRVVLVRTGRSQHMYGPAENTDSDFFFFDVRCKSGHTFQGGLCMCASPHRMFVHRNRRSLMERKKKTNGCFSLPLTGFRPRCPLTTTHIHTGAQTAASSYPSPLSLPLPLASVRVSAALGQSAVSLGNRFSIMIRPNLVYLTR